MSLTACRLNGSDLICIIIYTRASEHVRDFLYKSSPIYKCVGSYYNIVLLATD